MPVVLAEPELLFAAAICHAGIAAFPAGAPVLKGLAVRPWIEATDSVPIPLLTDAGFGATPSADEPPLALLMLGVALGVPVGVAPPMPKVRLY